MGERWASSQLECRCSWKFGLGITEALVQKACGALVPDSSLYPDPALSLCSSLYRGRVFSPISLGSWACHPGLFPECPFICYLDPFQLHKYFPGTRSGKFDRREHLSTPVGASLGQTSQGSLLPFLCSLAPLLPTSSQSFTFRDHLLALGSSKISCRLSGYPWAMEVSSQAFLFESSLNLPLISTPMLLCVAFLDFRLPLSVSVFTSLCTFGNGDGTHSLCPQNP